MLFECSNCYAIRADKKIACRSCGHTEVDEMPANDAEVRSVICHSMNTDRFYDLLFDEQPVAYFAYFN